jgi:N-acetylglutamate synthase-like GNAT family acetyltransferase
MDAPGYRVRRATTDDLKQLSAVWTAVALPAAELEKRFTEFQVAEGPDGRIVGAIALQVVGTDGKIHSESFADFALSDTLRPLFWQRIQTMSSNHGLFRLWTAETAPFWKKDAGFTAATGALPEALGPAQGSWLTLRLKDESADPNLIEAQFALYLQTERAKREKLLQSAATLKVVGTVMAVVLFVFSMVILFWFFRHRHR